MSKKVAILTGGGDCPGLNPAIRGCVMAGIDKGFEFIGLQEGWRGLVEGKTQPLDLADVKEIVGKVTQKQVEEIAKLKIVDTTAGSIEACMRTIAGTARSMGIQVA